MVFFFAVQTKWKFDKVFYRKTEENQRNIKNDKKYKMLYIYNK